MYNSILFQQNPVTRGQEIKAIINDIRNRDDEMTRIQEFLIFMLPAKIGEHSSSKDVEVTRKLVIAEKIKQNEEERNEN